MSAVKRKIQAENLAKKQPLVRELIKKYTYLPASAKEQFQNMRETAQLEHDGNA